MIELNQKKYQLLRTDILKRDGRRVAFNKIKIADAIRKAFDATEDYHSEEYCMQLADEVVEAAVYNLKDTPTVEQIQDLVEEELMKRGHAATAKKYILYRAERSKIREKNSINSI